MSSQLTGFPDLTLSFANPSVLEDMRFHPCVRFRPWESHQILSFVPPDGQFKLMSYRVKKLKNTPLYVKPQITSDSGACRVSVLVGIRSDPEKTIESITLSFQLPHCVSSADLSSNHGTVTILSNKVSSGFCALSSVSSLWKVSFLIGESMFADMYMDNRENPK